MNNTLAQLYISTNSPTDGGGGGRYVFTNSPTDGGGGGR
jgi:hypothetical protein